jgi:hypothetical protein
MEASPLKRISTLLALTIAALSLVAGGCGGGDDTTTVETDAAGATGASGAPLSEQEFVSQGNDICAAGNKELDQVANQTFSGGQPTQAQIEQYATETAVPSIQAQIDDIRALQPPESIASDVDAFLNNAQDALDQVKADPQLLAASDNAGPFADVNDEAVAIGLDECAG